MFISLTPEYLRFTTLPTLPINEGQSLSFLTFFSVVPGWHSVSSFSLSQHLDLPVVKLKALALSLINFHILQILVN